MIQSLGNSYRIFASNEGGRIVDRVYPKSPGAASTVNRFKSFREVLQDSLRSEFPELLDKAGFVDASSIESKINLEPRGYVVSVPEEHLKKLQTAPPESGRERALNSLYSTVPDFTGSLVNMSV